MYTYNVVKNADFWEVFETQTALTVFKSRDKSKAMKKSKFWSKGGGFWGYTPYFMTITTKEPE